jgi:ABC-type nitrate/sulfonate/bicarbonate transport system substrate-binding protein
MRLKFGVRLAGLAVAAMGLALTADPAAAQDVVRHGLQRGALGALKVTLPLVQQKYNLKYDLRTFNDSTTVILAMEQKELEMGNLTAQHVVRAIDEGMSLVVVIGWGGGYNVLFGGKDFPLARDDFAGLKKLVADRKAAGNKLKIGVPTGSQQHLKLTYLLKNNGIDSAKDVDILNIPFPNHIRSVDGKEVDMAMTIAPFAALAVSTTGAKVFHHVYGKDAGQWEIGQAVRTDLVKQKPDLVQRIVSSHVDAMKMFVADVAKQVEFEQKETTFPKPVVEMIQKEFLRLTIKVTIDDIKLTAKQMFELGWAKKDHSAEVEKYVDLSFLAKATGMSEQELKGF